jgi:zinc protease
MHKTLESWLRASTCCAILFVALVWSASAATLPSEERVARATLPNGLQVIVVRNALAPTVSTVMNYFAGADETPRGFPGTAHALEHMMFRGSRGLSAAQLADLGSIMGGEFNANTQQSLTQYTYSVPASQLEIVLRIESVRMRDVTVSEKDWREERGAITQEVAQDISNPMYTLYTQLRATLFEGTSYAHDALGSRESFARTSASMLRNFHRKWYAPNNALLVIVGDVDPDATLKSVSRLFGSIPSRPLPKRGAFAFKPVSARAIAIDSNLPYGVQVIAFRLPGLGSPDIAAAEVLADALKSRRGKLYELVVRGKALAVDFELDSMREASIAYAIATYPSGADPAPLEAEMRAVIAGIARDGVAPDLLEASKLAQRRALETLKESISGAATAWSQAVALNGLQSPAEDVARIQKVTVEDVNRVAREHFTLDRAVSAVLTPKSFGQPVQSTRAGGSEKITLNEIKPTRLPSWARQAVTKLEVPQSKLRPVVSKLQNGITLIVQPENISAGISVYGHVKNRPELQVPAGKEGLAEIVEELFSYGTETLDRVALQRAYDDLGADGRAGVDFAVQVLGENFEPAVALLAENQLRPRFPEDAFATVKKQVIETVESRLTSPSYLGSRSLAAALFPAGDPALREALPKTVEAVTLADVRDYYRSAFRPDLTTIVVIGNVTPERAREVIEKNFGGWRASGPLPETDLPPVPQNKSVITRVPDKSRVQDEVTLAETIAITRSHPDYYALVLGNTVLGGSFYSTRLTRDIRMSAGLVYSIDSAMQVGRTRALYLVQFASDPGNVSRVHAMVVKELEALQKTPVTAGELQRAKALLINRIPISESNTAAIALGMIRRLELGLPLDEPTHAARRYLDIGAGEVRAAFAKHIRPGDLARVSQGPP